MKNVKIGIIVVGLAAAAFITFYNMKKGDPIPDTPETKTLWMCAACQKTVEWTTKEEVENAGSAAPPLYCPACKARELYRARRCPECDTPFFAADVPNSTGKCPKCNPDAPVIAPPEVEDKEDIPEVDAPEGQTRKKPLQPI